jgi:hypothetical protein
MRSDGKILLVIAEAHGARDELVEGFRRLGLVTIPVADPQSASVVVRSVRPDLVLWHGASADAAGRAAVADWRERCAAVPIVLVAAVPAAAADGLRRSGADAVVSGPVAREHLEGLVLRLLDTPTSRSEA